VFIANRTAIIYWHSQPLTGELKGEFIQIAHLPPRQSVYDSINQRVIRMLEQNAIKEVQNLLSRNLDPALPVMKALGVAHISAFLKEEIGFDALISSISQDTRHYAKRQFTWFNNNFISEITNKEKYSKRIISNIFSIIPK